MLKATPKIVHLTSVHVRFDTRIFVKMCSLLAENGYSVSLVVADGKGEMLENDISIIDVGATKGGRFSRMTKTVKLVFDKAKELDADVYHLHDPELITVGLKLKKLGKSVIFDAHEDFPKQILGKFYLNKLSKLVLSKTFELYERWTCPKFDAVVAATPFICNKFLKINPKTTNINNFPVLEELWSGGDWKKKREVAYVGGITEIRGIKEVITAMSYTQGVRLNLAGTFSDKKLENLVKNYKAWSKVNDLGFLNRQQMNEMLAKSRVGVVTFLPAPNHINAQPNKMFEYMSAGLPIIASNFPLWREIVEGNQCGICVDPSDPRAIGEAMQYLIDHPLDAEKMGKNGRRAVETKFNWSIEGQKLISLYEELKK